MTSTKITLKNSKFRVMDFNRENPKFIDWNQDIENIQNELIISP